jgi:hypothetical protein
MMKPGNAIRWIGLVVVVSLSASWVVAPRGVLALFYQVTPEPTPRDTATPAPYIEISPNQGVAYDFNQINVTGYFFTPDVPVRFLFDDSIEMAILQGVNWQGDGSFTAVVQIPQQAPPGMHQVIAVQNGLRASASYELIAPTPTPTFTPTPTWTPSLTPSPTLTRTPVSPTPTWTSTLTPTPSPTLRPVTPMVTITPFPPTRGPVVTSVPTRTRTPTPLPGTPTNTLTPSVTPTPSYTPGPGTPSATPQLGAGEEAEMAQTGGGWGVVLLWGLALAGLVVVFRVMRVKSLGKQH